MKYIFVILAIVALVYSDEYERKHTKEILEIRNECLKQNPLSEETLKKRSENRYPDEESVRKYLLCTVSNVGIFVEGKGYDADRVVEQFRGKLDKDEVAAAAKACIEENHEGSDDVLAYKGLKCLLDDPNIGGLVNETLKNSQ